jgi:hypothetical protein
MDAFHQMLPEDEILLCGMVFLIGLVTGGLCRLIAAWRGRRIA